MYIEEGNFCFEMIELMIKVQIKTELRKAPNLRCDNSKTVFVYKLFNLRM